MEKTTERVRHSLVLLTYTRPDLAQARILEISRLYMSRPDVELLVFDNGSPGPNLALTLSDYDRQKDGWAMQYRIAKAIDNLGFGGGWNAALKYAQGEIIYMISDDVRIYGDFIAPITDHFAASQPSKSIVGQTLINRDAGWNRFGGAAPIPYLMGHFIAMERKTWIELGGFDNKTFAPYDYEDIDLCYRAARKDINLVGMPHLPIYHELAGTIGYSPTRMEHTIKMRARFAEKWNLPNVPEMP